jgi:hypothetical protein
VNSYKITLESDTGQHAITINAGSLLAAISAITAIERAPESAITKIERVKQ